MTNLEQFYASVGSDASEIVSRLGGDPGLVTRFLMKFPADGSFSQLCSALDSGDREVAFRAAHTMKGTCANLGIRHLFEKASAVTELLRGGDMDGAKAALPELESEYRKVIDALSVLNH